MELDPLRPTPLHVDGLDLVAWRVPSSSEKEDSDDDGSWCVMADRCPHRLAPLSEGRLEPKTGMIQCAYHGWEFDQQGACTRIPQVEEEAAARMRASPRACAVPFPAAVALRCLWAWLGPGEPVGRPEDVLADARLRGAAVVGTYSREVPFGYERFLELFVDASTLGEGPATGPGPATAADHVGQLVGILPPEEYAAWTRRHSFELLSPFLFMAATATGEDPRLALCCVPTAPGRCRAIVLSLGQPGAVGADGGLPAWARHLAWGAALDADIAALQAAGTTTRSPWRQWLAREGASCAGEAPQAGAPPRGPLLDRWGQHASRCVVCQSALQDLEKWQGYLGGGALAALALDRLALGPQGLWLAFEVAAVVALAGTQWLKQELQSTGDEPAA